MSFFGKVDKSTTGSVVKKIAKLQFLAPSKTPGNSDITLNRRRQTLYSRTIIPNAVGSIGLEEWFIGALVGAGQCKEHGSFGPQRPRRRGVKHIQSFQPRSNGLYSSFITRRRQHTLACAAASEEQIGKDKLLALVDHYELLPDPSADALQMYQLAPGPNLTVSDKSEDVEWPPREYQWPADGEGQAILQQMGKVLKNRYYDSEAIFQLYRSLPSPRVPYLSAKLRHQLLRNLGTVLRKDERSMMRYLSVIDDMKLNAISLTREEWNTATSFVASYMEKPTAIELEASLKMFKEMEHVAGVEANSATFNILFDAATKAGKFHLAEIIYEEMKNRGLPYNRFHHVSLIYFHGLRGDGDSVRSAYKSLVDAGEIVDTVVMNCVIASLIRAREPQAAMHVYERMKRLHVESSAGQPPRDARKRREIDRALVKLADRARQNPELLERYKKTSIIAPDIRTYRLLINHLAVHGGQLHMTTRLLDDMSLFNVPIHGSIFLALFNGFAIHGGELYSHWTAKRLESVWTAFVKSHHDERNDDVYIGKWTVIWALRAFKKCAGINRTQQVWEEIDSKWSGESEELDVVKKVMSSLVESNWSR
jgi:pentatricopeptide repeat protein